MRIEMIYKYYIISYFEKKSKNSINIGSGLVEAYNRQHAIEFFFNKDICNLDKVILNIEEIDKKTYEKLKGGVNEEKK